MAEATIEAAGKLGVPAALSKEVSSLAAAGERTVIKAEEFELKAAGYLDAWSRPPRPIEVLAAAETVLRARPEKFVADGVGLGHLTVEAALYAAGGTARSAGSVP